MSNIVEFAGNFISDEVRANPLRARRILAAIYSGVDVKSRLPGAGLHAVEERYVGHIASVIAKSMGKPGKCALVNVFLPHELTYAFDVTPLIPEAVSVYLANTACSSVFAQIAEESGLPESFCSYHKVMAGLEDSGVLGRPLLVANTTLACDANILSFRRVAQNAGVPHVVIDVPYEATPESIGYVEDQIYELIAVMEDLTHSHLDISRLQDAVAASRSTFNAMREFYDLRGPIDLPRTMTGVFCDIMATHCLSCSKESLRYAEGMVKESRKAQGRPASDAPRIFWMHTLPNWQIPMRDVFEDAGISQLVGVDFSFDSDMDADPARPVESLAKRLLTNVNNGAGQARIERAVELAKKVDADGVVIFCHWGCKQTLGLSQMAKEAFESQGIAALVLDGDGCDPRNVAEGQMVTRAGAFLEQLRH